MSELLPIVVLLTFVTLFGVAIVVVSSFLGPKVKQSKVKSEAYECGIEVQETGQGRIPIKFYLTAILFILFDIEIIFMYPWAIAYSNYIEAGHGQYILISMAVFLAVFIFGLFWEIKSRALEWE